MNAVGRCVVVLQATFLGTLLLAVLLKGDRDACRLGLVIAGCAEVVLLPASLWIPGRARRFQTRRFSKIALLLWLAFPLGGYAVLSTWLMATAKITYGAWHALEAMLLYSVLLLPLASVLWLPGLLFCAFWIERWMRVPRED